METVHLPIALPLPASSGFPGTQVENSDQPAFSDIFSRYFPDQPVWSPLTDNVSQFVIDSSFNSDTQQPAPIIKELVNGATNKPEHALLIGDKSYQITAATDNLELKSHLADGEESSPLAVKPAVEVTITNSMAPEQEAVIPSGHQQQIKRLPASSATNINREQSAEIHKIYEREMPLQIERQAVTSPASTASSSQALPPLLYGEQINKNTTERQNDAPLLPLTFGAEKEQPILKSHRSIFPVLPERIDQLQSQQPLIQSGASSTHDTLKPQIETRLSSLETQLTTDTTKSVHSNEVMSRAALANPTPKLGQRVLQMISRGESSIEIRLDPPELGKLTLSLSVDKDSLNLQITTSNSAVRDLLLTHDGKLRHSLAEQGMSLGNLGVNVQSGQQDNHQQPASSNIDTSGIGVLADETEVDQLFISGALLFKAQGGRLLDQFI